MNSGPTPTVPPSKTCASDCGTSSIWRNAYPSLHLPPTVLDIKEEADEIQYAERPTKIKSVDYGIFRKAVEGALKPLFDTSPVLKKIRFGEQVSAAELLQLNSLVHTRHPDVDLATLREFFPDTACRWSRFCAASSASITPRWKHALRALQVVIRSASNCASLPAEGPYPPVRSHRHRHPLRSAFTSVHTEGLSGVFHDETQLSEIVALIRSFGEPPSPAAR
jgi:type I restriction enzyme R subunit